MDNTRLVRLTLHRAISRKLAGLSYVLIGKLLVLRPPSFTGWRAIIPAPGSAGSNEGPSESGIYYVSATGPQREPKDGAGISHTLPQGRGSILAAGKDTSLMQEHNVLIGWVDWPNPAPVFSKETMKIRIHRDRNKVRHWATCVGIVLAFAASSGLPK
jgi:hypothetical protein